MIQPRAIAIETSSRLGSVALALGRDLVAHATLSADMQHARELVATADQLVRQVAWSPADLQHCYLSIGPGSFTGLRVGVTFARHLALATGAQICAVPTLDVIARNALTWPAPPAHLIVMLDAKRAQVFAARYHLQGRAYHRTDGPMLIDPATLLASAPSPVAVIGEGVDYHLPALTAAGAVILDRALYTPDARQVLHLGADLAERGHFTDARALIPEYIRRPEAEELWEKRHGKTAPL